MRKKVLVVPTSDYVGHPFPQRLNHICEKLSENDNLEIHVIRFKIFKNNILSTKTILHEMNEISTSILPLYYFLNMFLHGKSINKIIVKNNIDIIILSNLAPALGYFLLRKKKIPIIYDVSDYFPTSATGYLANVNSFLGKILITFFNAIFNWLILNSDLITVASNALLNYVKKIGKNNVELIPNGIGSHFFSNSKSTDLWANLGYSNKDIIVGYIGSMEFWLKMEPLLIGIKKGIKVGIPLKFLIVGGSLHTNYYEYLQKYIKNIGLDDVVQFYGYVPYKQVPNLISCMDITTLPFDTKNPTAYYSGPNKLWEYLSQEKLVISSPIPESLNYKQYLEIASTSEQYLSLFTKFYNDSDTFQIKTKNGKEESKNHTWVNSALIMNKFIMDII